MRPRIKAKDVAVIILVSVLLTVAVLASHAVLGGAAPVVVPVLVAVVILAVIFEIYRRLSEEQVRHHLDSSAQRKRTYQQVESLFSLFHSVRPERPLPDMRHWAASPDLLKKAAEIILRERPSLVLEAGSGVSSVIIGYCLKRLGGGRLISLDHDGSFAAKSAEQVRFHGLQDFVTVVHAPLTEVRIKGKTWLWYDTSRAEIRAPIDFLVIDGPPWNIQELARYPALPLLYDRLSDNATMLLDDGGRRDEKRAVALWGEEFEQVSSEFLDLEKGAFVLRKGAPKKTG